MPTATATFRKVLHTGPTPCRYMVLGEGPGRDEDHAGFAMVGMSGRTLDATLRMEGLERREFHVRNVVEYWTGEGNPDPTQEDIDRDRPQLLTALQEVGPELVIPLGRIAKDQFESEAKGRAMEDVTGLLFPATLPDAGWKGWILPIIHPAAGFRDPWYAALFYGGVVRLGTIIRGLEDYSDLSEYEWREWKTPFVEPDYAWGLGIDTEGSKEKPWCITVSSDGVNGALIRPGETQKLADLGQAIHQSRVILHHALHDLPVLRSMGIEIPDDGFDDTMLMGFVYPPSPMGLKEIGFRYFGVKMREYEDVVGPYDESLMTNYLLDAMEKLRGVKFEGRAHPPAKRIANLFTPKADEKSLRKRWKAVCEDSPGVKEVVEMVVGPVPDLEYHMVPEDEIAPYAKQDAVVTVGAKAYYFKRPDFPHELYHMDLCALPMLDRMSEVGLRVDTEKLEVLQRELEDFLEMTTRQIRMLANSATLNPGSDKQIGELLYGSMGLATKRMTKSRTRMSVDDRALRGIRCHLDTPHECRHHHRLAHKVIDLVLLWREAETVLTSYVIPLWKFLTPHSRVHPNWKACTVVSGRLASENPNLLAFPAHSVWGKKLRTCFPPDPGYVMCTFDLDQIELRVMASESGDAAMIAAFLDGIDIHSATAADVFGIPIETAKGEIRTAAKSVNFGIGYGETWVGLQEDLRTKGIGKTEDETKALIAMWWSVRPGVAEMRDETIKEAKANGNVKDMWGRMRWLPGIWSEFDHIRNEAERQAFNMKIQGGAAGCIKKAMGYYHFVVAPRFNAGDVQPLLQIHDELIFQIKEEMFETVKPMILETMGVSQERFVVPISAKASPGPSWGELEK